MKKRIFILFGLVLCLLLTSCNGLTASTTGATGTTGTTTPAVEENYEMLLDDLSLFLDREAFLDDFSWMGMVKHMESYHYQGSPLPTFFDGNYDLGVAGGYQAVEELFGFACDFSHCDCAGHLHNYSFYTKVPLEGLVLPMGITFEDTLEDVLKKMGFAVDAGKAFVADSATPYEMTLCKQGETSLTLTHVRQKMEDTFAENPLDWEYTLTFEEYQLCEDLGMEKIILERSLVFSFLEGSMQLGEIFVEGEQARRIILI